MDESLNKEVRVTCKDVPEYDRVEYTVLAGEKLTCVLPSPEAYSKLSRRVACLETIVDRLIQGDK